MAIYLTNKQLKLKQLAAELRFGADTLTEENKLYYWEKLKETFKLFQEFTEEINNKTSKADNN